MFGFGTKDRPAPDDTPGYRTALIDVAHRDVPLPLHLWYPTDALGPTEVIGQNLLFYGAHVQPDATPKSSAMPVVVLIHGSGGNGPRMGWIATALANAGYLVVAANHPGVTSQDSWPSETVKIWERPKDVTAFLDWLASDGSDLSVDMDRIGILGFSIGGHSALALAGLEVRKESFLSYCASFDDAVDCDWMERGGFDLTTIDAVRYDAVHSDPRVRAVEAIDPALPRAVHAPSLATVSVPVQLINLGDKDALGSAVRVTGWDEKMPDARYHNVSTSWHFSFLAECSLTGRVVIGLLSRKTEEICTDVPGRDRQDVHRELHRVIAGFLASVL